MKRAIINFFNTIRSKHAVGFIGLALLLLTLGSCSTPKSTLAYSEDLSANRPGFSITETPVKKADTDIQVTKSGPAKNVNAKVDAVLDSIDQINRTKRYMDGFTIQIYSGQKREEAMNAKQRMVNEAGDLPSSLQYIQPKFRVTVGSYVTRLEAQKDLVRLKHYFSAAILVPEKITMR